MGAGSGGGKRFRDKGGKEEIVLSNLPAWRRTAMTHKVQTDGGFMEEAGHEHVGTHTGIQAPPLRPSPSP